MHVFQLLFFVVYDRLRIDFHDLLQYNFGQVSSNLVFMDCKYNLWDNIYNRCFHFEINKRVLTGPFSTSS